MSKKQKNSNKNQKIIKKIIKKNWERKFEWFLKLKIWFFIFNIENTVQMSFITLMKIYCGIFFLYVFLSLKNLGLFAKFANR